MHADPCPRSIPSAIRFEQARAGDDSPRKPGYPRPQAAPGRHGRVGSGRVAVAMAAGRAARGPRSIDAFRELARTGWRDAAGGGVSKSRVPEAAAGRGHPQPGRNTAPAFITSPPFPAGRRLRGARGSESLDPPEHRTGRRLGPIAGWLGNRRGAVSQTVRVRQGNRNSAGWESLYRARDRARWDRPVAVKPGTPG